MGDTLQYENFDCSFLRCRQPGRCDPPHAATYTYPVHTVAKSTIKFKTAGFEPVVADTPADTQKIELVEKEHEQEILTPAVTYAHAPVLSYAHAPVAVAPAVAHVAAAAPVAVAHAAPAVTYGLGGFPFAIPAIAAAPAEAEAAAEEVVEA